METIKIYDAFKQLFPLFDVQSIDRVSNYSISIGTSVPGLDFIFTYKSPVEWRFETVDMFGKGLEKENTNESR